MKTYKCIRVEEFKPSVLKRTLVFHVVYHNYGIMSRKEVNKLVDKLQKDIDTIVNHLNTPSYYDFKSGIKKNDLFLIGTYRRQSTALQKLLRENKFDLIISKYRL